MVLPEILNGHAQWEIGIFKALNTEKRLRTEIKSAKTILKLCVSAGIHATLLALLFTNNVLLKLQKYSTHLSSELVVNNHIDKICEVVYFKV